ncbi:hypothetical protein AGLY_013994 [Aphis glycines]|uniref:Uncharacterized protein n=1 Tax=Aphis glycines TaxID=307491 RepID=A0A6G0T6W3_APHGL|nr:hypothetical protein AGLY_013994 [Aphis glycines]
MYLNKILQLLEILKLEIVILYLLNISGRYHKQKNYNTNPNTFLERYHIAYFWLNHGSNSVLDVTTINFNVNPPRSLSSPQFKPRATHPAVSCGKGQTCASHCSYFHWVTNKRFSVVKPLKQHLSSCHCNLSTSVSKSNPSIIDGVDVSFSLGNSTLLSVNSTLVGCFNTWRSWFTSAAVVVAAVSILHITHYAKKRGKLIVTGFLGKTLNTSWTEEY